MNTCYNNILKNKIGVPSMYHQMILAFRDSTGYNGLSLYAEGLSLNKIISNIGKLALTEKPLTTFEEIKNIVGLKVIFSGVTENEFREYTEIKKRISDQNGLFDDVISYHLNDYLLFDLVDNLVIFPDYEEFESDCSYFPVIKEPLESLYKAYTYTTGGFSDFDGIIQYSIENKMVLLGLQKAETIHNTEVKRLYSLQSIEANSTPVTVSYCCLCGGFNCSCTYEQLEEYSLEKDNLPF